MGLHTKPGRTPYNFTWKKKYLVSLLIKSFYNKRQNETEYILAELKQMYWTVNDRTSIMKVARQFLSVVR